ncbi:nuclear transport factor 2 family protein [uncultured Aurantimicrobium sp.]|jgi:ketosteroid isomerase-like protein|uniref:nuclear transport factor 2 family protein n=1 Tax=uncultured Aurantimicrobium sp. TaxID=1705357 RepID=UPI00260266E4|nr:nuclear transport factor 2 family protein [uncultured Aurantimicrobium sp.]
MSAESIVKAHYLASAEGNISGMFQDFSPDIVWKESEGGIYSGTFTGLAQIAPAIFDRINSEWDSFEVVPELFLADEETGRVAAICDYVGTHKASGKAQENVRAVHLWTVKNDKIVAFEQICDTAQQNKFIS